MLDNAERSGPHRQVEVWLREKRINFESEIRFDPYRVDIYLPEWHLALEIDGPGHSPRKDRERDEHLLSTFGVVVLHLPLKRWYKAEIMQKILDHIETHADSAEVRKCLIPR